MKTALKIVNNLINKRKCSLKCQLIKRRWVIIGNNEFMSNAHFTYKIIQYTVSIGLTTLAHVLNANEISLNTRNYQFLTHIHKQCESM